MSNPANAVAARRPATPEQTDRRGINVKYADESTISFTLDHSGSDRVQLGIDADTGLPFYEWIVGRPLSRWRSAVPPRGRSRPAAVIIDGGMPMSMIEYDSREGIDEAWYVVHAKDVAGHD